MYAILKGQIMVYKGQSHFFPVVVVVVFAW